MTSNKENIKKWIVALRSGKYQQGTGNLLRDGKYCCLGVACEVAIQNGIKLDKVSRNGLTFYDGDSGHLPVDVLNWLGLSRGVLINNRVTAIEANDARHWSFSRIARHLERTYLAKMWWQFWK